MRNVSAPVGATWLIVVRTTSWLMALPSSAIVATTANSNGNIARNQWYDTPAAASGVRSRCQRSEKSRSVGGILNRPSVVSPEFAASGPRERSFAARPAEAAARGGAGRHGHEEADRRGEAQHQEGAEGGHEAAHDREAAEEHAARARQASRPRARSGWHRRARPRGPEP